jgi:MFS family permease
MFAGILADKFGRRKMMIFGCTLLALNSIMCYFVDNKFLLFVWRFTGSLFGSIPSLFTQTTII